MTWGDLRSTSWDSHQSEIFSIFKFYEKSGGGGKNLFGTVADAVVNIRGTWLNGHSSVIQMCISSITSNIQFI